MENIMICNCKQVSASEIERVLETSEKFSDAIDAFNKVQEVTHCSTGCGGCHDKILDFIADHMSK